MVTRPKLADPGALIRSGKLPEKLFRVCLDPELVAEHERLVAERDSAKETARDSLAGGNVAELEQRIETLLTEVDAATLTLRLRAMSRPDFRALVDKHPARKDGDGELTHSQDMLGFNYETFFDAAIRASIVEPELDADTLGMLLDERLTDMQWQELAETVWELNRVTVNVPFSQDRSRSRRHS